MAGGARGIGDLAAEASGKSWTSEKTEAASAPQSSWWSEKTQKASDSVSLLDELTATVNQTALGLQKGATWGAGQGGAGSVPSLPSIVTQPLEQAGEAFGKGAAKGAGPMATVEGWLSSVPAPIQVAGGVAIAVVAGALIFVKKGR